MSYQAAYAKYKKMPLETKQQKMIATLEKVKTMRKDLNEMVLELDNLILELTEKMHQAND